MNDDTDQPAETRFALVPFEQLLVGAAVLFVLATVVVVVWGPR